MFCQIATGSLLLSAMASSSRSRDGFAAPPVFAHTTPLRQDGQHRGRRFNTSHVQPTLPFPVYACAVCPMAIRGIEFPDRDTIRGHIGEFESPPAAADRPPPRH